MATTDKYDRQLRLWGAHGQRLLMNAKICLLHASATGAETLKNLVLPGVGDITIVDDALVTERDVSSNFFVTAGDVGKPRGQTVLDLLLEMNEDVKGSFVQASPSDLIASQPDFFSQFTLVIASQMPLEQVKALSVVLEKNGRRTPLLWVRTFGLIGYLRVFTAEHTIVELKPQSSVEDLRIVNPWPELRAYCDDGAVNDLPSLDGMEHKHVPWVVLLIKALDAFKDKHNSSSPPSTFSEKKAFKELVNCMARGSPGDEENFEEAANKAALASRGMTGAPSSEVMEVLSDPAASPDNLSASSPSSSPSSDRFWWAAAGISHFVQDPSLGNGVLPLSGEIPDMTATTDRYVSLLRLYRAKHAKDVAAVWGYVRALLEAKGIPLHGAGSIPGLDEDFVRETCKNARFLRVFRQHAITGEAELDETTVEALREGFEGLVALQEEKKAEAEDKERAGEEVSPCCSEVENNPLLWYCALRAADACQASSSSGSLDAAAVLEAAHSLLTAKLGLSADTATTLFTEKHAAELCRYCGLEPLPIAALIASVAAQEAVKLITHQYSPLDNSYVYCGINGVGASFRL